VDGRNVEMVMIIGIEQAGRHLVIEFKAAEADLLSCGEGVSEGHGLIYAPHGRKSQVVERFIGHKAGIGGAGREDIQQFFK